VLRGDQSAETSSQEGPEHLGEGEEKQASTTELVKLLERATNTRMQSSGLF
jgi:hypothetical protein